MGKDKKVMILLKKDTVLIAIYYYLPDYRLLLNEFWWQHDDIVPGLPRTHAFLGYWKKNIDAVIQEVLVSQASLNNSWRKIDWEGRV
jgi:uncharacterized protein Usg